MEVRVAAVGEIPEGGVKIVQSGSLFVGVYQAVKNLRKPEQRRRFAAWAERQGRKPMLRPLAAVLRALWIALLRPLWRFVIHPAWRVIAWINWFGSTKL